MLKITNSPVDDVGLLPQYLEWEN